MKLRLRAASNGASYRVEIPQGCTWKGLQTECRSALGLAPDAELQLSLNKKVPLGGEPDVPISTLGLCNGDLLWLLAPDPPGSPSANSAHAPTCTASAAADQRSTPASASATPHAPGRVADVATANGLQSSGATTSKGPVTATTSVPASAGSAAAAGRMHKRPAEAEAAGDGGRADGDSGATGTAAAASGGGSGGAGGGGDVMEVDGTAAAADGVAATASGATAAEEGEQGLEEQGEEGAADVMGPPGVSLRLRRLLMPPAPASTTTATGSAAAAADGVGAPATAAAAAAAPSASAGSGTAPWFSLPAACRAVLLMDCALAEAGFTSLQDLPSMALASSPPGNLPRQLLYGCPYIADCTADASTPAAAVEQRPAEGSDVSMAEAGQPGGAAAAAAVGAASGDAGGGTRAGSSSPQADQGGQPQPQQQVQEQRQRPVAKVMWYGMGRYLVVHGVPCGGGGGGAVTLHIDLSEYSDAAAAAAGDGGTAAAAVPRCIGGGAAGWRRLKDGFALPLLAACCRTAGVAAPLGLLVLPLELQLMVLTRLQAKDLAALSGACTALHALASEDLLWRPLLEAEFGGGPRGPALSPGDLALANSRGYKALFARRWRQRAELRRRRQMFRPVPPPVWGPPPLAPFMRPPFMPPGAIGGDYDRLPAPLLGGGTLGGVFSGPRGGVFAPGGGVPGFPGLPGLPGFPTRPHMHPGPGGLGMGPRPGRPWGGGGNGGFM